MSETVIPMMKTDAETVAMFCRRMAKYAEEQGDFQAQHEAMRLALMFENGAGQHRPDRV